ncbi:MAG: DNA polymerase III subunit delta' [Acidobacteria bacterium]|nr:DNA polymerase III subunit delta' [Acidobacteriota bacterium]
MFEALSGNTQIKTNIERLVRSGNFPQSAIFSGKEGIGKKMFALEIARSAVCQTPIDFAACNRCHSCVRATKFALPTSEKKEDYERVFLSDHPDLGIVIPNKQTIYINAIRELEREANFRPYEAKTRYFIIEEAEKMSQGASNALLKTLEEPAETTHLILITSKPASLLSTIRSRCQTIRFAPVGAAEIEKYLFDKLSYSSEDAKLIARVSNGSIGLASNTDPDGFRRKREQMFKLIRDLARNNRFAALLQTSEEINSSKARADFESYLSILQTLINDLWKVGNDRDAACVNFDLRNQLLELKEQVPVATLARWLEEIESLRKNLRFNLNRKVSSDALFMRMAAQ